MKKLYKSLLAIILCVSMLVCTATPAAAANVTYLSDLKIAYGSSVEEASQKLSDAKFKAIKEDLNKGAGNTVVCIGYRTTTDPKKAITDISAMNMKGGYIFTEYEDILKDNYSNYKEIGLKYEILAKGFREKYAAKSEPALRAYKLLNMYEESDTHTKMGDFFLNKNMFYTAEEKKAEANKPENKGKFICDPIVKIISEANTDILTTIDSILTFSICSYSATQNIFAKLNNMTAEKVKQERNANHYNKAEMIFESAHALGAVIKRAEEYMENFTKDDEVDLSYAEAYTLSLTMKDTKVGDKTLYDIIVNDNMEIQDLYPFVSLLNDTQATAISFTGLTLFLKNELLESSIIDSSVTAYDEAFRDALQVLFDVENEDGSAKNETGTSLSIYSGVDRSVFSNNVAVTYEAARKMNQSNDPSPMFGNISKAAEISMLSIMGVSAATAIVTGAFLVKGLYGKHIMSQARQAYTEAKAVLDEFKSLNHLENFKYSMDVQPEGMSALMPYEYNKVYYAAENAHRNVFTQSYKYENLNTIKSFSRASAGFGIAMGVLSIVGAVFSILELCNYYNPDYTEIPKIMMDKKLDENGKSTYIRYTGVKNTDGDMADVNALKELQWIALYYTKDKNSGGSPLKTSALLKYRNGYKPIHMFGYTSPYNLNSYTYKDADTINLYFAEGDRNLLLATRFSMENGGYMLIAGFGGALVGCALTLITMKLVNKKRQKEKEPVT